MTDSKPKIFVFINGRGGPFGPETVTGAALAEDGEHLAGHLSSSYDWFMHDMGLTSDWKHDNYREHYPDGYELVHVQDDDVRTHPGLDAACKLNQKIAERKRLMEGEK